jgi:hypothetical protein
VKRLWRCGSISSSAGLVANHHDGEQRRNLQPLSARDSSRLTEDIAYQISVALPRQSPYLYSSTNHQERVADLHKKLSTQYKLAVHVLISVLQNVSFCIFSPIQGAPSTVQSDVIQNVTWRRTRLVVLMPTAN